MMWDLIERGCEMPAWVRCLLFIALMVLPGGALWLLVSAPVNETDELTPWRAQWQRLRPLLTVDSLSPPLPLLPFSVTGVQHAGVMLQRWQPEASGGTLTLTSDWQSVPALFPRLAERGMLVTAFTLTPQENALLLELQLEQQHEE